MKTKTLRAKRKAIYGSNTIFGQSLEFGNDEQI